MLPGLKYINFDGSDYEVSASHRNCLIPQSKMNSAEESHLNFCAIYDRLTCDKE